MDIHIDEKILPNGQKIELCLSKGEWKLSAENAIYSYGQLYDNFDACFRYLKIQRRRLTSVCLLGGGMGSIIELLEKKYAQHASYTYVESTDEVIGLFEIYVLPSLRSAVEICHCDAYGYTMQARQKFDLICMDVFEDNIVPAAFLRLDFLSKLNEMLKPNGILIFNVMEENKNQTMQLAEFAIYFSKVFPRFARLSLKDNKMFIGYV